MKIASSLIILLAVGCGIASKRKNDAYDVEVIKYVESSSSTQSFDISERSFWNWPDLHAKFSMRSNLVQEVQALPIDDNPGLFEFKYAFIFQTASQRDTMYSDRSLKHWLFINKMDRVYRIDKEGEIASSLGHNSSFFSTCW